MDTPSAPQRKITMEQKVGFVLLLIFGLLAVGLGGMQLRNTIYGPFVVTLDESRQAQAELDRLLSSDEARLQRIDTDQDSLNDYEELTFYETSPYLADSDSDGIDDAEEVSVGSDPNCPNDQVCSNAQDVPKQPQQPVASPLLNVSAPGGQESAPASAPGNDIFRLQDLVKDPQALRKLLLETGQVTAQQLQQINDDELQDLAAQLLATQANTATSTTAVTATSSAQ